MNYSIKVIFGKEQVDKHIANIPLTGDELKINVKDFTFKTEIELAAFKKGINEAIGWIDCYLVEDILHEE